jgi:hypothetical protein
VESAYASPSTVEFAFRGDTKKTLNKLRNGHLKTHSSKHEFLSLFMLMNKFLGARNAVIYVIVGNVETERACYL